MIPMPQTVEVYNACTERCDMAEGPCSCGAWHQLSDWPHEVRRLIALAEGAKQSGMRPPPTHDRPEPPKGSQPIMTTTLDIALIRWSVVCRKWDDLSANSAPVLGAFLAGWYWRDMGNTCPPSEQIGVFRDSFRVGWRESDAQIAISKQ